MKKLSIEQMENVNGGGADSGCDATAKLFLREYHKVNSSLAADLFFAYLGNCTALKAFM